MEEELVEFKAPSGDLYKLRRLRYRERKDVMRKASVFESEKQEGGKSKIVHRLDIYTLQEQEAVKCIVEAPWLSKGKKCTLEMLDNIKPIDIEALDARIDELNFARGDELEKSDGQSELVDQSKNQK